MSAGGIHILPRGPQEAVGGFDAEAPAAQAPGAEPGAEPVGSERRDSQACRRDVTPREIRRCRHPF